MMFLSALINTKLSLVAGMAIGVGMAKICREMCKKKGQLANRNTATKHETSDQVKLKKRSNLTFRQEKQCLQTDDRGCGNGWQK